MVQKVVAGQPITEEEWDALALRLNTPEFYFAEAALRKAFGQPTGSLTDFIRAALGLHEFPTREQRIERAFNTWVAEHSSSINPEQAKMLRLLRNVVLAAARETKYDTLDPSIFSRYPFRLLGGRAKMQSLFGEKRLVAIMDELRQLISAA
ncbi:MAG: hypothetical protein FJ278_21775 [Planctomycetes bacterium]|nr:hypothetical protein [Planctomycetota bacterium]